MISLYLFEIEQKHNAKVLDVRYGCEKIKDFHRQRLCRLYGKIAILKNRLSMCQTRRCKRTLLYQLQKWRMKYAQELHRNKTSQTRRKK